MEKTMQNPKLIPVPFANSGIKDDIPKVKSTSMLDEKASWETGFPEATMLPVYAGGLPPDGKDFNGVLNQISENLVFQSKGGRYKFDSDFAISIGGYPKGAILQTNDESAEYQSLINNNLVDFNTASPSEISEAWRITGLGDAADVLNGKLDKSVVTQELGTSKTEIVSQDVVTQLGTGVVGSFENGLTHIPHLTNNKQQVTIENEYGIQAYCWKGEFPKEVPIGSTPESTGGIAKDAWDSVGDASFRSDIKRGDGALIGVDGDKNLKEKLTEIDSTLTDNNENIEDINVRVKQVEFESINPASPRNVIQYRDAKSVNVLGSHFPMGGFRFMGQYYKTKVPTFSSDSFINEVNMLTTLPFSMDLIAEQWYAVFAVANDDSEKVKFITMPYLRVDSILNSTITLRKAGEMIHTSSPVSYEWNSSEIIGSDVLVISETMQNRKNAFSGRVTSIKEATSATIKLNETGSVGVNDWMLPAPNKQYKYYRYCGTFYHDKGEVRNLADSGDAVKFRGVFDKSGINTGVVTNPERREPSGYISPLASGLYTFSQCVFSTATTGLYSESFSIDDSHVIISTDYSKTVTTSSSYKSAEILIPFMFGQQYYFANSGSLASIRTQGQQNLWGWVEK